MARITLKGKPIHTNGNLPKVNSPAPIFKLVSGDLSDRSLKDEEFQGKRKLLSIVPSLDTPVCSLSTKKFNEQVAKHPNVMAFVISADLPFAQKRVCGAEGVKNMIPLSMMRDKSFAENYGVLITEGPLAGLTARAIIVLDEKDRVIYTELVPEISHEPDYDKALSILLSK